MSIADTNKLTQMIKQVPDQAEALTNGIQSITDEVADLTKEQSAITTGVCGTTKSSAIDLIENTILSDKGGDYVLYGPTFGTISFDPLGNLTDWAIIQVVLLVPTPIYVYTPGDYPDLDEWVSDYSFGNDYITRPLTEGATYGLSPNISTLNSGKSILQANKAKVEASIDIFKKYAT